MDEAVPPRLHRHRRAAHPGARADAQIARHLEVIIQHELARLRRVQFSTKSERMNHEQRELFDEAMAADIAAVEAELDALQDSASVPSTKAPRARSVRRPLPPELPREITVHAPKQCDYASSTLDEWLGHAGLRLEPLIDVLRANLKQRSFRDSRG